MFEKFTEKALQIVTGAQQLALENNFAQIYPELILIAFTAQKSCFSTKLLTMSKVSLDDVVDLALKNIETKKTNTKSDFVNFSDETINILKDSFDLARKAKSGAITTEHLFLSLIKDNKSAVSQILEKLDFDTEKAKSVLSRLFEKRTKKNEHPEGVLPK